MSQDLLAISRSGLKMQLPTFDDGALYETVANIREWRKLDDGEAGKKVYHDVEMKERMLLGEICRRYGTHGEGAEKFLLAVPADVLAATMPGYSLGQLKNFYVRVIQWKRRNGDKAPYELTLMMLRKEGIIRREFSRRGLTESEDFKRWNDDLQRNLTKDGRIGQRRESVK